MSVWWIIPVLLIALAALLTLRALRFIPKESAPPEPLAVEVDGEAAIRHFQELIRFETVSNMDPSQMDEKVFSGFKEALKTLYPTVHEKCLREEIGSHGLLFTWKGKSADAPSVFMAHYDVVPVNPEDWREPPFSGNIKDGELWGRGTLDTKGTLLGAMEAAETLLKQGFTPENDIYLAFGGDEEVMGQDAPAIVDVLEKRGVRPAFVLDEGGAIVDGVFPGVTRSAALIGIAEKGCMSVDITATGTGGHASAPPARQSMVRLARAIKRLSGVMPFSLTVPAKEMFDVLGRHSGFAYRLIFANLWFFGPLLSLICARSGGELNALVRTSCAFTRAKASEAYNVLPTQATAGLNLRVICGESIGEVEARLNRMIRDKGVTVKVVQGSEPSKISTTYDPAWNRLDSAIRQTYPQALVAPYLMLAASDSRHYCRISDHVYRFSGMPLTKEQRGLIHNANERILLGHIKDMVAFFARMMRMS